MSKENRDLISQLKVLNENIELLTKVTAITAGKDAIFKNKKDAGDKIEALDEYDLPDKIIAMLIGSTENSVSSLRSRKKAKSKSREVQFTAQDLQTALGNIALFPSTQELIEFTQQILDVPPQISSYQNKDQIVESIILAFKNADKRKQALFIQALERRASARELKDTEFLKFLEGWESRIKG